MLSVESCHHRFFRLRQSVCFPLLFLFVLPASTNYQLRDYGFGSGGGDDYQSTNYVGLIVTAETTNGQAVGTTYRSGHGLIFTNQAEVPAAPTLTNPNTDYQKLKLTLAASADPTDTTYALAISSDDFVTTSYIQNDAYPDATLGPEDFQTYAAWGGASGFFILGLLPETTYQVKAKARQGDFTETEFGPASAGQATSQRTVSFSIGGVASGTAVAGVTTDVTTTSTAIPFGDLTFDARLEAAQTITVTTNAAGGYTVRVRRESDLANSANIVFPTVSGTNTAPAVWPGSVVTGAYGYHTNDATLGTGTTTRFASNDTFAQFETSAQEVASAAAPVTNEQTSVVVAIQVGRGQPPGAYLQTITYTMYGVF